MKTVNFGRYRSGNDEVVIINDDKVSRLHCRISQRDDWIFFIRDCNSTNGTFVNGQKIRSGIDIPLKQTDNVRIGNSMLNWLSYFSNNSRTKFDFDAKNAGYGNTPPGRHSPPNMIVEPAPIIPPNLNIRRENINADVYKKGDDFAVPFKRNIGNHIGNAIGQVGGCLIWIAVIALIAGIIALFLI